MTFREDNTTYFYNTFTTHNIIKTVRFIEDELSLTMNLRKFLIFGILSIVILINWILIKKTQCIFEIQVQDMILPFRLADSLSKCL